MAFSCIPFPRIKWKKLLRKRVPIIKWLPKYRPLNDLLPDFIAGVTVALTAIPQSIAYASVAGLTPEYGLYSNFISCFVYLFLGSCRQMTIGPTALMQLLVYEKCGPDFAPCVVLVGFWAGCIQFLMGLLRLGALVSVISDPVTIGFVAGASLVTCSSQLRSFFRLSGPKGDGFFDVVKVALENIHTAKLSDTLLGCGCVAVLLLFKYLKEYVKPDQSTKSGRYLSKFLQFLSMGRNAFVVIVSTVLAATLSGSPFALTGTVKSGLPPVAPPDFRLPDRFPPSPANSTDTLTFWETWGELGTAPLMIAVVSILQNVAIAKAFGSRQSIDTTQEMIALGVSHVVGSFFSALPTAGSFTRSIVNEASGVKSPVGGIFTGTIVMLALSFLTRWFAYIPKASLAAVILCAVLPMIEYQYILPMWRVSKIEVLQCAITFVASLVLGMEYGIIIGVGVSLIFYLVRPVRPKIEWKIVDVPSDSSVVEQGIGSGRFQYHFIKPETGFQFPSVDSLRTLINKMAVRHPQVPVICLDCDRMIAMDFTSSSALAALVKALRETGKELVLLRCETEWVHMMEKVGLRQVHRFESREELERWLRLES